MKSLSKLVNTVPRLIAAIMAGALIISGFLWWVYANGNNGQSVRSAAQAIGEEIFGIDLGISTPEIPEVDPIQPPSLPSSDSGLDASGKLHALDTEFSSAWMTSGDGKIDKKKLASLNVETRPASPYGYKREYFGPAWKDIDHNGCDTRNDILARDLRDVTYKNPKKPCVVESGTLSDPYSGNTYYFTKKGSSRLIDIEHVIALEQAWDGGAYDWSQEKREQYANDPLVLMVVDGPLNRQKGSDSISEWTPPNTKVHCRYAQQTVEIAAKYDITISRDDYATLNTYAKRC